MNKTRYYLLFDDKTEKELVWVGSSSGSDGTIVHFQEMPPPPKPYTLTAAVLRAMADKMVEGDKAQLADDIKS